MKISLTKIALALSTAFFPLALHAQSQNVAYGRLSVNLSSGFLGYAAEAGISVTDLNGNAPSNGSTTFTGIGGALDVRTAQGELQYAGGYVLTIGSNKVELTNLVIDTTNASSASLTALVVVNGTVAGRMPIFTLASTPHSALPLQSSAGTVQLTGVQIYIAPAIASELNGLLGQNVVAPGLPAGTETQYSVFTTYSGS